MSINKERAWETLKELSFVRVSGTEDEKRAAEFIKSACGKAGVEAWLEPYDLDLDTIERAELTVLGQSEKTYPVLGVAHTGNTPDEGIVAPFVYIEEGGETCCGNIRGKICLVVSRMTAKSVSRLKALGALGFITCHGSFYDDEKLLKEPRQKALRGNVPEFPGVSMHIRDMEELMRDHSGEKVRIVLKQTPTKVSSQNVVAVIPGTRLPEEEIAVTAHYDSVPYSKGSWDNGSGSVLIMEMLRHYAEHRPDRTLRFIWCGSEEIGLKGSAAYCKQHKDDLKKIIYNINFDMVGVTVGGKYFTCTASESVQHAMEYFANVKGQAIRSQISMASSDSTSFAEAGVPASTLGSWSPDGGAAIHSYRDSMDRMDPESFARDIQFALDYVDTIANASANPIPREFSPSVKELLQKAKVMHAEVDGLDSETDTTQNPAEKQ